MITFVLLNPDFVVAKGLAISYAYATGLLIVAMVLRRRFNLQPELTRKFIHVGAGIWVFGVLIRFNRWQKRCRL